MGYEKEKHLYIFFQVLRLDSGDVHSLPGHNHPAIERGGEKYHIENRRRRSEGRTKGFVEGVKPGAGIKRAKYLK